VQHLGGKMCELGAIQGPITGLSVEKNNAAPGGDRGPLGTAQDMHFSHGAGTPAGAKDCALLVDDLHRAMVASYGKLIDALRPHHG
jgi:hypothetical protein